MANNKNKKKRQASRNGKGAPKARRTYRGPANGPGPVPGFTNEERRALEEIFAIVLRGARDEITDDLDPLTVQVWASHVCGVWWGRGVVEQDTETVFCGGLVDHAARAGTPEAVRALRALSAVAPEPFVARAREAAEALVSDGVPEPPWRDAVTGTVEATAAAMVDDPVHDDGVNVLIGFDGPTGPHAVGVYIDHNLGGMAKDLLLLPVPWSEVLAYHAEPFDGVRLRVTELDVAEAASRWRSAFWMTDHTLDPAVSDDLPQLRALALARLTALPEGKAPDEPRLGDRERDAVLDAFLGSPHALGLIERGVDHDVVDELAFQMLTYSCDYVRGTPLRFSPVMVELFCCDWATRKIAMDGEAFEVLPEVLRAWIRFAGERRGIPTDAIEEAVAAVSEYEDELAMATSDPSTWGPAKALAQAMRERGIDLTDPEKIEEFVGRVNRGEADVRL